MDNTDQEIQTIQKNLERCQKSHYPTTSVNDYQGFTNK